MEIITNIHNQCLTIFLNGDLDEYNAGQIRAAVDKLIAEHIHCTQVVFNLTNINFMDSTGIGFLLGRYKKLQRQSTTMYIQSPNYFADKVLSISGVYALIPKL